MATVKKIKIKRQKNVNGKEKHQKKDKRHKNASFRLFRAHDCWRKKLITKARERKSLNNIHTTVNINAI